MKQRQRIRILKLAQADPSAGAPASAPGTTTTTAPATSTTTATTPTIPAITVDIRSMPNFRSQLFSARPDLIIDMNNIVGIVNKYMQLLSGNKVNFSMMWKDPSVNGTQFDNSLKNLYALGKWLYVTLTITIPTTYTMDGLKQVANGIITTTRGYSFPDPAATHAQSEIITAAQNMLTKLG